MASGYMHAGTLCPSTHPGHGSCAVYLGSLRAELSSQSPLVSTEEERVKEQRKARMKSAPSAQASVDGGPPHFCRLDTECTEPYSLTAWPPLHWPRSILLFAGNRARVIHARLNRYLPLLSIMSQLFRSHIHVHLHVATDGCTPVCYRIDTGITSPAYMSDQLRVIQQTHRLHASSHR